MILNKTTEYALRILAFMMKEPDKMYSASYLIEALSISDKYLRRIMTNLSKAGFIKSIQGREGGYVFNKDIQQIYVSDIIEVTEGLSKHLACVLGLESCSDKNPCALHAVFEDLKNEFVKKAKTVPLSQLNFSEIKRF
ncbi:MAG: Rrf2 family transcriptional regulator [Paludibacteraceae bacterium]